MKKKFFYLFSYKKNYFRVLCACFDDRFVFKNIHKGVREGEKYTNNNAHAKNIYIESQLIPRLNFYRIFFK